MDFGEALAQVQAQAKPRFGEPFYYVRIGGRFYVHRGKTTIHPHQAAFFGPGPELAEKIAKRYGGSVEGPNYGYGIVYARTLEDIQEPDSVQNLQEAVELCQADGLDTKTIRKIISTVLKAEKLRH